MLEKPAGLLKVIKEAINVERDGYHFYQTAAGKTKDVKGKTVFRSLAQDELDHSSVLEGLQHAIKTKTKFKFTRKGHGKKSAVRSKNPIFSAGFKSKIKEDHFELSALRIGQLLERNSMEFYSKHANRSKNRDLKALFNFLFEWEKDHLKALVQQERFLKGKL
ncbi:MAG: ferritin family protein [Candidatus Zixiibacteriota bacterium]|nr:MAG: ferritin family protein [candidate division Zixibacteria bacterium]